MESYSVAQGPQHVPNHFALRQKWTNNLIYFGDHQNFSIAEHFSLLGHVNIDSVMNDGRELEMDKKTIISYSEFTFLQWKFEYIRNRKAI